MKENLSSSQESYLQNNQKFSEEFKEVLAEEDKINRARIMADAMLEENPNLSPEEALKKAMEILSKLPLDSSEICHNKKDE